MAQLTAESALAQLTMKHRECLDLALRQRMTSKQIARALGIAKVTVDQRLGAARRILDAADRDDAVVRYGQLLGIYDRVIYDPVDIPPVAGVVQSDNVERQLGEPALLEEAAIPYGFIERQTRPQLEFLGVSIDNIGGISRVTIIAGLSIAMMLMLLAGLSIANTLGQLTGR